MVPTLRYVQFSDGTQQLLSLFHGDDLFFDDESWRMVPHHGTLKMPINHLYDIGDRVFGAIVGLRKTKTFLANSQDIFNESPDIAAPGLACMLDINRSLDCWLNGVRKQNCSILYSTKHAELWHEVQLDALAAPCHFPSLTVAAMITIYVRPNRLCAYDTELFH